MTAYSKTSSNAAGGALHMESSESVRDPGWDEFLLSCPLGQYQQSSMWAETKLVDGWQPWRLKAFSAGKLVGGFQLLCRRTKFGRIGYVAKGPVVSDQHPEAVAVLLGAVKMSARKLGCRALIVQPPDYDPHCGPILEQEGYLPDRMVGVIDATLLLRLGAGPLQPDQILHRSNRRNVRLAQKRGLAFVERESSSLPEFFELMRATCARQQQAPNPSSVEAFESVWRAFSPGGHVRLFFVTLGEELVSGQVCLAFGRRITFWKRGWSGQHGNAYPNDLLTWSMIERAAASGYGEVDFGSLKRSSAEALLAGKSPDEIDISSRDRFHIGFGGTPVLQPPARVFIANPLIKFLYQLRARFKRGGAAVD